MNRDHARILVIGGTGVVGMPIVRALHRAGWSVRVMSRSATKARQILDADIDLVAGDATATASLDEAMQDCHAVLVCVGDLLDPSLELRVTERVVELAPRHHIERIGLISGPSVAEERRDNPGIDGKYRAEEHLKASGLHWVIIRPSWPMESLARFVRGNTASVFGRQPSTIHPLAGPDLGRMVERAFALEEAVGHTFTLFGPEGHTMKSWLEAYCALVHPNARVKNVPLWVLSLTAALTRDRMLKAVVELMRYFEDLPECGNAAEANRVLGAPRTTLRQWVLGEAAPQ